MAYCSHTEENGYFHQRRSEQAKYWMYESIHEQLQKHFYSNENIKSRIENIEDDVIKGTKSSFIGAQELLDKYFTSK